MNVSGYYGHNFQFFGYFLVPIDSLKCKYSKSVQFSLSYVSSKLVWLAKRPKWDQFLTKPYYIFVYLVLVTIATFFRFLSDCLVPLDRQKCVASKTAFYCCLIPIFKTFNWLRSQNGTNYWPNGTKTSWCFSFFWPNFSIL